MKGIILAGGAGTRLMPLTAVISKQLLPVYDKPMIFYSLSVLLLAGIKDILIISTEADTPKYQALFKDGSHLGIKISYKVQPSPDGLAQAFILGEEFIGNDCCAMILGDNIFYGNGLSKVLLEAAENARQGKATIFGYYVDEPHRFGVVEFDKDFNAISIEEKPAVPKSNYAVTGLYFYDNRCVQYAKSIKKSLRGELEITDLNKIYLENKEINVKLLGRGYTWFDTGTIGSLLDAANYVKTIQQNQGITISAIEEIAYKNGWITKQQLSDIAKAYGKSQYGKHLANVAEDKIRY